MTDTVLGERERPAEPLPGRWRTLALLGIAQFMLILDVTVVAIALPHMGADLGLGRAALTWVVSAYTLTFGGLLLLGGRSADYFGSRAVVLTGLTIFTAASLLTGLATGGAMLITGRVGQGLGAALLSPGALSVVVKLFDGAERNKALGIWSGLGGAGAAVGVLLGGVLTAGPGWQWVFYINVPIGLVILLALARRLPSDRPATPAASLDVVGALLVTAGTAVAVYGLVGAGEAGWLSASTLLSAVGATVLYAIFALHQRTVRSPLMDLGILARRSVATGTFLILVATALMISVFFLGTFYLQHLREYGPLVTGLLFLPVAAGTVIGAQVGGRTVGALGARVIAVAGLAVTALGAALPAIFESTEALVLGISVAGLGLGAGFVAASTTALSRVAHHEAGLASGILSTFHEFGAALGVAVTSSLAVASITGTGVGGFQRGFTFAAVTAAVAGLICLVGVPGTNRVAASH